MALNQWMTVTIKTRNCALRIANARLDCGKFHEDGNFDNELSVDQINNIRILPGTQLQISSSGRQDASMGTAGQFDLFDGDVQVGSYSWDVPWGSSSNKSEWRPGADAYVAQQTGAILNGPNLGNVTLTVVNIPA